MVVNRKLNRVLEIAHSVALAAPGVGHGAYRVGAVLFDKKVVMAKHNEMKTHTALSSLSPWPYLHAESNCILSHGLDNCQGMNLMVCRILKNGDRAMAKPCPVCSEIIARSGIKRVYFTNNDGNIELLQ